MPDKVFYVNEIRDLRYQVMNGVEAEAPLSATFTYINDETGEVVIAAASAGVDAEDAIVSYTLGVENDGTTTPGLYRGIFSVTFADGEEAAHVVTVQIKEREGIEDPEPPPEE